MEEMGVLKPMRRLLVSHANPYPESRLRVVKCRPTSHVARLHAKSRRARGWRPLWIGPTIGTGIMASISMASISTYPINVTAEQPPQSDNSGSMSTIQPVSASNTLVLNQPLLVST